MEYEKKIDVIRAMVVQQARWSGFAPEERQETLARKIIAFYQWKGTPGAAGETASAALAMAAMVDGAIMEEGLGELAFCEVTLALEWGMRGEWGDYTGVNADNLFRFVRRYAESEERREALRRNREEKALPPAGKDGEDEVTRNILASYARLRAEAERSREARRRRKEGAA